MYNLREANRIKTKDFSMASLFLILKKDNH